MNAIMLCRAVTALVGHDGSDNIRVIVDAALRDNPQATAEDIADIIRTARADWAAEQTEQP
jgi:hypothetical protein